MSGASTAEQRLQRWLLSHENGKLDVGDFLAAFAAQLHAEGIPVSRMTTSVTTMHPEVFVRNVRWRSSDGVLNNDVPYSIQKTTDYIASPVEAIREGSGPIRVRLPPQVPLPYPQLNDVRAQGSTDYLILPLPLRDRGATYLSLATDHPDGFTDAAIETLKALGPAIAIRIDVWSLLNATRSLLTVYLGHHAAERVLSGQFQRGSGQELDAAILFCDMRGFSSFSDTAPMRTVVSVLDAYFERVAGPIAQHGGEILKFIGDAVLAVFPVGEDPAAACAAAFLAATEGISAVDALGDSLAATGGPRVRAGMGIHRGRVLFGNIGAEQRLDFTVIGPAVNEASRIESLCKELREPVLVSDDVARLLDPSRLRSLGRHPLRGIQGERELFAPAATSAQ